MIMKWFYLISIFCFLIFQAYGQDVDYARRMLRKLSGEAFHGRGYVKNGDGKAADFISRQFKKDNLLYFETGYFQTYYFPVNTFPGLLELKFDGTEFIPGDDFVISSNSPALDQVFSITVVPESIKTEDSLLNYFNENNKGQLFILPDEQFKKLYGTTVDEVKAIAMLTENKPYWHVKNIGKVENTSWLKIKKSSFPENAKKAEIIVQTKFIAEYQTQNIVAYVKGEKFPDQFVIFSAHYDHLGRMGKKTCYPGANDNGSGTAMLLDLAKYYSDPVNKPDRSVAFIAFSGEETGLMGSNYFAEHPLLPLEKIQLLVNLDMVGTGSEGITVVNGELFPDIMKSFSEINSQKNYLPDIAARGESCNSDHCPFYQNGVKSVFIYTRGNEHTAYHIPEDSYTDFPFTAYTGLFKLLKDYVNQIK